MKRIITYMAAGLAVLSAGGAWAWHNGGSDDHGSGSESGSHEGHNGGGTVFFPPTVTNPTVGTGVFVPTTTTTTTTTTGGGNANVPQQAAPVPAVTSIPTALPTVLPIISPTASPSASASPLVFGVLGPCPTAAGTTGVIQPAASPTSSASPGTSAPQCINVAIPPNARTLGTAAYGTNPLAIPVNTTVTWVNNDSVDHTVTSDDGSFDSGVIAPGQTFSMTFVSDGFFRYHCSIHGAAAMSGALRVGNASPTPSATASPATTSSPVATSSPAATSSPSVIPSAAVTSVTGT